jgi:hypothetical protein
MLKRSRKCLKTRRKHSPVFKVEVGMVALLGIKNPGTTDPEIQSPSQLGYRLETTIDETNSRGICKPVEPSQEPVDTEALNVKISRLTLEYNFVESAFNTARLLSAKRNG